MSATPTTASTATPARRLVLTRYIDRSPAEVEAGLTAAVSAGLDDARVTAGTEPIHRGLRLVGDADQLAGSEVVVGGIDGLSELTIAVPWHNEDAAGAKLLVADRFAQTVAESARVVAAAA
ncbi:MAG: hypothetical protein AAF547_05265 [Actinomycetota bacterium]